MPVKIDEIEGVAGSTELSIHGCIREIMRELQPIGKNQRNKDQDYAFRGIDDVLKALHPLLAKYGVFFAPSILERQYEERTSARGTTGHCAHLHVLYRVYGPRGDFIEVSTWGEGLDYSDKATNKAMTAAFKYAMFELFAICDPSADSDRTTEEGGSKPVSRQRPASPLTQTSAAPTYSALQSLVRAHPFIHELSGQALTELVSDAIGYANPGLRDLPDEDCEKVLARLSLMQEVGAA